jgi:hypothetical protein
MMPLGGGGGWQKMAIFARGVRMLSTLRLSGEWEVPVTRNAKITPPERSYVSFHQLRASVA